MSRHLRDELRDVFDTLSEPAHPALASRIRDQIEHPPSPVRRAPRFAVAMAVLVSMSVVVGLLLAGHRALSPHGTPAVQVSAVPAETPTPVPATPAPGVVASAPPASAAPSAAAVLPGFSCAAQAGGTGTAGLTGVRAGPQTGYDRFVIQFDGPVPPYRVSPRASASFTEDPKGSVVTLPGSAGLAVTVSGVGNWQSLPGPSDVRPVGTSVLKEARQVGDFEGTVTWGLGLSRVACFRAYTLTAPNRLVVDVQR